MRGSYPAFDRLPCQSEVHDRSLTCRKIGDPSLHHLSLLLENVAAHIAGQGERGHGCGLRLSEVRPSLLARQLDWMGAMWTLQDAKSRFSAVVDAALAGRPQEVTRRGRPAVVVLSFEEYQRLVAGTAGPRGSFAEHLQQFPGGATSPSP